MENTPTVELLSRLLEAEEASDQLNAVPADTYINLANYSQRLRTMTGTDDATGRLAKKQLWLIEMMTRRLVQVRIAKVRKDAPRAAQTGSSRNLLSEERYITQASQESARREERLVRALVDGQPSFFALIQRKEMQRMTTVRISKRVGEIMGADLKRYGPFEVNDVARLPYGNAQVMVASNQAVPVSTEEEV